MILRDYRSKEVARDVSWHPYFPVIASTSFNGNINIWTRMDKNESDLNQKVNEEIKELEEIREQERPRSNS